MRHKSQEGQTNDDDDDADKRYQRYQKRTHKTHTHSHCVMSVCFVVNLSQPQTHHLSFGAHTGIRHTLAHALTPITRFDLPVFAIKYRNKCIFGSCLAQFFLLSDFFFFFLLLCDCVDVNFRVCCACRLMTLADGRPFCVFLFSQCRLSYIYIWIRMAVCTIASPRSFSLPLFTVCGNCAIALPDCDDDCHTIWPLRGKFLYIFFVVTHNQYWSIFYMRV